MSEGGEDVVRAGQAGRIGVVPAVRDLAVCADDEHRASQDVLQPRAERVEQPVVATEVTVEVAQQHELVGQAELRAVRAVGKRRVDGNAVDLDAPGGELLDAFSELGKLVGSTRREIENVRQKDHRAVLESLRQLYPARTAHR